MDNSITLTIHGVELSLIIFLVGLSFKQYNIYKAIKERVNIIWREYCKEHHIPYNAVGDDKLVDIKGNGDFK